MTAVEVFKAYETIPKQTVELLQTSNSEACLLYIGENLAVVPSAALDRDEARIWEVLKTGNGMPLKHLTNSDREAYMQTCCKVFITPATLFTRAAICRMAGIAHAMKRNKTLPRLAAQAEMVPLDFQPILRALPLDQVIVPGTQPDCTFGELLAFSLLNLPHQDQDILEELVVREADQRTRVKHIQQIQLPVIHVTRARKGFWGRALTKTEVDILPEEVEEVVPAHLFFLDEVRDFMGRDEAQEGEEEAGGGDAMEGVEHTHTGGGNQPVQGGDSQSRGKVTTLPLAAGTLQLAASRVEQPAATPTPRAVITLLTPLR